MKRDYDLEVNMIAELKRILQNVNDIYDVYDEYDEKCLENDIYCWADYHDCFVDIIENLNCIIYSGIGEFEKGVTK